jgi:hypothetical protein
MDERPLTPAKLEVLQTESGRKSSAEYSVIILYIQCFYSLKNSHPSLQVFINLRLIWNYIIMNTLRFRTRPSLSPVFLLYDELRGRIQSYSSYVSPIDPINSIFPLAGRRSHSEQGPYGYVYRFGISFGKTVIDASCGFLFHKNIHT